MQRRSIFLGILFWVEAVVSARILLFSVPVMINKGFAKSFAPNTVADCFILIITVVSLLYLFIGIASIGRYKFWRFLHYLAAGLVFALTVGVLTKAVDAHAAKNFFYYVPVVFSIGVAMLIGLTRDKAQTV